MRLSPSSRNNILFVIALPLATGAVTWTFASIDARAPSVRNVRAIPVEAQPTVNRRYHSLGSSSPDGITDDPKADNFISFNHRKCGNYIAASRRPNGPGVYLSSNLPKPITRSNCGQGLFLLAQPGVVTVWHPEHELETTPGRAGMRVVLVNRTAAVVKFPACDYALIMVMQARDAAGGWLSIEHRPTSDCPASYYISPSIEPEHFWEFAAPRYQGPLKTKLRFAVRLDDKSILYSNEFDGSIDPKQFPRPPRYREPEDVDPWNDWPEVKT